MKNLILILIIVFDLFSQYDWSTPKMISDPTSNYCSRPRIAIDNNGVLHAVWMYYYDFGTFNDPIVVEYAFSNDDGITWSTPVKISPIYEGDRAYEPLIVIDSENNIHVMFYLLMNGNIYYIKNVGGTWSNPQFTGRYMTASPVLGIDKKDRIYYFYYDEFSIDESSYYIFKDPESNWSSPVSMGSKYSIYDIKCSGDYLFAGGRISKDESGEYITRAYISKMDINTGIWTDPVDVSNGNYPSGVKSLDISDDEKVHIAYSFGPASGYGATMYRFGNNDLTNWSEPDTVSVNMQYSKYLIIDSNNSTNIFEYYAYDNVYYIINSFQTLNTWEQDTVFNDTVWCGYPNVAYNDLNKFYIVYYYNRQIYFQTKTHTGLVDNSIVIKEYMIEQNYPNPFNSQTKIIFNVKESANIKLDIFNSNGQIIETLLNQKLNQGKHEINFNAENLNSGIFYCTLTVNGITKDTRKLLYLK